MQKSTRKPARELSYDLKKAIAIRFFRSLRTTGKTRDPEAVIREVVIHMNDYPIRSWDKKTRQVFTNSTACNNPRMLALIFSEFKQSKKQQELYALAEVLKNTPSFNKRCSNTWAQRFRAEGNLMAKTMMINYFGEDICAHMLN